MDKLEPESSKEDDKESEDKKEAEGSDGDKEMVQQPDVPLTQLEEPLVDRLIILSSPRFATAIQATDLLLAFLAKQLTATGILGVDQLSE